MCLLVCIWKERVSIYNRRLPGLLTALKFQSQGQASPLPFVSLAKTFLGYSRTAQKGSGCGSVSVMTGRLTGVSSTIAFPLELGPRPTWRGSVARLSPNGQGLEQWELCQR